jgi:hypothetical protein
MIHACILCLSQCEQADIHVPLATVREALEFSAALRLTAGNRSSSGAGRSVHVAAAVDELLRLVELEPLAARLVGTPGELVTDNGAVFVVSSVTVLGCSNNFRAVVGIVCGRLCE